jgi:preprotein translocase subunit YajC
MSTTFAPFLLAAAAAPAGQQGPPPWWNMLMFAPLLLAFYFLMIRPQQKRAKQHAELLKTIKSGDKVATSSGIIGVVVTVKERTVSIRSEETKLEVLKSAVSEVLERKGEAAEAKS